MSKKQLQLSRRTLLAGVGTAGIAAAGAGLGTTAWLNDEESFDGNMITAGELDLTVNYTSSFDQGSYASGSDSGTSQDEDALVVDLDDVKPGDSGSFEFCFEIDDNPAYMWACGELTSSEENGYTEPEPEDGRGEGELEENIEVDVAYCHPDDSDDGYSTGATIFSGTLREALTALQAGIPLDGTGDAGAEPGSQAPYDGTENSTGNSDVTNPCVCFDWEVPTTVGNEIQGDSVGFDLQFNAQQSRHNDGSANPCITSSTGNGFAKEAENFNGDATTSAAARARYGNNGTSGAWELAAGDEPGVSGEFSQEDYVWTSGDTVDWSVSYDAASDELSLTVDGTTVSDTIDDPQPDGRIAIQGKADEATVDASIDSLSIGGAPIGVPSGPTSVTATNDGSGRQVRYLLVDTALDGDTSIEISGEATVSLQGDYGGGQEDVALDLVFE